MNKGKGMRGQGLVDPRPIILELGNYFSFKSQGCDKATGISVLHLHL
jgi:hypothetical protein